MILTAYIDEAGTHGGSPATVMGGYVARLGQWRHFDEKWNRVLKRYGLTHLHTNEMLQAKGQFRRGWDQNRAMELLIRTQNIINKHTAFGIAAFVSEQNYLSIYAVGERPRKMQLDSRYGLCFRLMLAGITQRLRLEQKDEDIVLNVVLESGARNAGDAARIFDLFKKESPQRGIIGALTFGRKEFPGLQAADGIASSVFQFEKKPPEQPLYSPDNVANEPMEIARRRVNGNTPVYRLEATSEVLLDLRAGIDQMIELRRQFGQRHPRTP